MALKGNKHGQTHGGSKTLTYYVWRNMRNRCRDKNLPNYHNYGGRGIGVCARWLNFESFLEDMGSKPDGMSLDRIDNDGDYEPGNCRWATKIEQDRNRRQTHRITHRGETYCITEWAEIVGLNRATLNSRLRLGWSVEKALTT